MGYFRKGKTHWKGFGFWHLHHFFEGIVMVLVAFYLLFNTSVSLYWVYAIAACGLWFAVDDWVQHSVQRAEIEEYGFYVSVSFLNWWPNLILKKVKSWVK